MTPELSAKMEEYARLLLRRNEDMNLTGAATVGEIMSRHILDSLAVGRFLPRGGRVVDVGSGAGFPGLPLAAAMPDTEFVLLDAREKRVAFLEEARDALGLINVRCVFGRAEELSLLPEWREAFDAAVSRAVARLNTLSELCVPLVKPGGVFVAMKAADCAEEAAEAAFALRKLGAPEFSVESYEADGVGYAAVVAKKSEMTPEGFPRRFSKIKKNPLQE